MSAPMTLAVSQRLDLNAEIDALIRSGDASALDDAALNVLFECARRYLVREIAVKGRRLTRVQEQAVARVHGVDGEAITESRRRHIARVTGLSHRLNDEATKRVNAEWVALLAESFMVNGTRVTWAEATVAQHETRAAFLDGLAAGNIETAAIHRAAVTACRDAHVDTLAEVTA